MSKSAELFCSNPPYMHRLTGELPPSRAARYLAASLPRRSRSEMTVVDSGCGEGRNTIFLAQEGFRVAALDTSEANLEAVRKKVVEAGLPEDRVQCAVADLVAEMPLCDASVSSVLDVYVLGGPILEFDGESGARDYLSEVYRVLKPRGCFLLEFEVWHSSLKPDELLECLKRLLGEKFVIEHWEAAAPDYFEKLAITPQMGERRPEQSDALFAVARKQ